MATGQLCPLQRPPANTFLLHNAQEGQQKLIDDYLKFDSANLSNMELCPHAQTRYLSM